MTEAVRSSSVAVVLLVALVTPLATSSVPSVAAVTVAAPTVTPRSPIVAERYTVTGSLEARGQRTVVLQKRAADGSWRSVDRAAATPAGRYAFTTSSRRPSVLVRVRAPRTTTEPAVRSQPRRVRTQVDQARLVLVGTTTAASAVATFSPARRGRHAQLQVRRGRGAWLPAGPQVRQDEDGRAFVPLPSPGPGVGSYRIRSAAWRGAAAYAGAAVTFTPQDHRWAVSAAPVPLVLTTEGGAPIENRDDYVTGSMSLGGVDRPMEIRGRGNSTWGFEKKPYRLKLATAGGLLGMPAERDWVLLANWADRTAMRNHLAFTLGVRRTSLAWTPRSRYVDVQLNGRPLGVYQLVEHVKQGARRVALPPKGLLLEVDRRAERNGDPFFTSTRGVPIAYKDPDDPTAAQVQAVRKDVARFERALYGPRYRHPDAGYKTHVDLRSFVDWYLLNEVFKNLGASFRTSVFLTWSPDGRIAMGPPWDFDLSAGSAWRTHFSPRGWWVRTGPRNWIKRMVTDPAFERRVARRWEELRPAVDELVQQTPAIMEVLDGSVRTDWALWHESDPDIGQWHAASYAGEVAFLQDFLTRRTAWITRQLRSG